MNSSRTLQPASVTRFTAVALCALAGMILFGCGGGKPAPGPTPPATGSAPPPAPGGW